MRCKIFLPGTAATFGQRYDGTAVGFLLLNSFGGYIHMGSWQQGWVCAIFFLGGVIGAYMRCAGRRHIAVARPMAARCNLVIYLHAAWQLVDE